MNCYCLANILMGSIYLFAGKFSHIVLNKAVYEKVVEMSTKRRQCRNRPNVFCYICGEYMMAKHRFNVRDFTKRAYEAYFGMKLGRPRTSLWHPSRCADNVQKRYKPLAPLKVCRQCTETLRFWTRGKNSSMRFGVSIIWRKPKNHHDDCYFCLVDVPEWNQQKKKDWYYPDIESARRPIPHCAEVPVSVFTCLPDLTADELLLKAMDDSDSSASSISNSSSMAAAASSLSTKTKAFSQGQLNDLVRDLALSKEWSEILASRLSKHGTLDFRTKITFCRDRDDF